MERGGRDATHNADEYLAYLNDCYGDPNAQARAVDRLRTMRQKTTDSFTTFLPRFEKELADSGGREWSDAVRINYLEGALNMRMQDRLVSCLTLLDNYPAYVRMLQTLGSKIDSFEIS